MVAPAVCRLTVRDPAVVPLRHRSRCCAEILVEGCVFGERWFINSAVRVIAPRYGSGCRSEVLVESRVFREYRLINSAVIVC